VKSTNYEAPRYAAFSTLPSLYPSLVQIFSTPCSETPSVYVPPGRTTNAVYNAGLGFKADAFEYDKRLADSQLGVQNLPLALHSSVELIDSSDGGLEGRQLTGDVLKACSWQGGNPRCT
jgi:hypothetical protein